MEWEGISAKKSSILHHNPPASIAPSTPSSSHEEELAPKPLELLDLGLGVNIVPLLEMDVGFNADYLTSQEQQREEYSSAKSSSKKDESDLDIVTNPIRS